MITPSEDKLFQYQQVGAQWLSGKRFGLLADEMGLGKSAQAIRATDILSAAPVLVLCPAVARLNWIREWQKFSSRSLKSCALLTGADKKLIGTSSVTVCSYDLASTSAILERLSQVRYSVVLLDESHYLKSRTAKRTSAALGRLAPRADRVWALSGTPAPNDPSELWPLLRTFGATALDYWSFVRRYCTTRETAYGTQITGGRNIPELRSILAPLILRRRKDDVMTQLPKISFSDVVVEPVDPPREIWERHFSNYLIQPDQFHRDIDVQTRLVETVTGTLGLGADSMKVLEGLDNKVKSLRRWIGLQKVPKTLELIKSELEAGAYDKIVIFAVHKAVLEELRDGLAKFGAVLIYGGTPPEKRENHIRKFQNDKRCRVFLGNVQAAGTAITLTAAHQVAVVEADWTPANNQQAVMRVHRIGQTKPVSVRFIGMAGSIDERIQRVLKVKTRTLTALFDEPEQIFAE